MKKTVAKHPYLEINPMDDSHLDDPNPSGNTPARHSIKQHGPAKLSKPWGLDDSDVAKVTDDPHLKDRKVKDDDYEDDDDERDDKGDREDDIDNEDGEDKDERADKEKVDKKKQPFGKDKKSEKSDPKGKKKKKKVPSYDDKNDSCGAHGNDEDQEVKESIKESIIHAILEARRRRRNIQRYRPSIGTRVKREGGISVGGHQRGGVKTGKTIKFRAKTAARKAAKIARSVGSGRHGSPDSALNRQINSIPGRIWRGIKNLAGSKIKGKQSQSDDEQFHAAVKKAVTRRRVKIAADKHFADEKMADLEKQYPGRVHDHSSKTERPTKKASSKKTHTHSDEELTARKRKMVKTAFDIEKKAEGRSKPKPTAPTPPKDTRNARNAGFWKDRKVFRAGRDGRMKADNKKNPPVAPIGANATDYFAARKAIKMSKREGPPALPNKEKLRRASISRDKNIPGLAKVAKYRKTLGGRLMNKLDKHLNSGVEQTAEPLQELMTPRSLARIQKHHGANLSLPTAKKLKSKTRDAESWGSRGKDVEPSGEHEAQYMRAKALRGKIRGVKDVEKVIATGHRDHLPLDWHDKIGRSAHRAQTYHDQWQKSKDVLSRIKKSKADANVTAVNKLASMSDGLTRVREKYPGLFK